MGEQKTVVITGGAGFIGSHLCDRFINDGYRVICVDNFLTGKENNIAHLLKHKSFVFVRQDVSQPFDIDETVHYVMHFASPASPIDYVKFTIETLKVGSLGTMNALELAKDKKATFMIASTSEVYGDPLEHPQIESYWGNVNPIGPRSMYDEAKRFSEALTMGYHRVHGVDVKILRIFNTYGPRMNVDDGRVVPNFINQALRGEPLTIYGDGTQTRSFCYVDDEVEGIVRLLLSNVRGPVNIGNPDEFTMLEFADIVRECAGSGSELVFKPFPPDDPKRRRPNIDLAKKELQWEPKVKLPEGVQRTVAWFKENG